MKTNNEQAKACTTSEQAKACTTSGQAKASTTSAPAEPVPAEIIRFSHVRVEANGRVTWWNECEGCYELQVAFAPDGPWYAEGQQPCSVPVEVTPQPGSARYYRAVSVPCPEPETQ